jgi:hemerythrin-like domain-containing protein
MCDYCECRTHSQIASLSDDHEVLLELLGTLGASIAADDHERARELLADLHRRLDTHAAREERGVFTQLRRVVRDDDYVAMFERDHQHLHELLDATHHTDWRRPAAEFVADLREHILREETDLFPAAHQMLEPRDWAAIDDALIQPAAAARA